MKKLGMIYEPFDILVVPFPFSDQDARKRRPALVISNYHFNQNHSHLILAMITTSCRNPWSSDIVLQDWQASGLSTACRVRLKLFTLDSDIIIRKLGRLSPIDQAAIQENMRHYLVDVTKHLD